MKERIRTIIIGWICDLVNWVQDHVVTYNENIQWQDHLRWWLEGKLMTIFVYFYEGSEEEIRDGIEAILAGEDPEHLTKRQLEVCPGIINSTLNVEPRI
ncbi:MAG: hypothetical protein ABFD76_03360 [Smithella sp.]